MRHKAGPFISKPARKGYLSERSAPGLELRYVVHSMSQLPTLYGLLLTQTRRGSDAHVRSAFVARHLPVPRSGLVDTDDLQSKGGGRANRLPAHRTQEQLMGGRMLPLPMASRSSES